MIIIELRCYMEFDLPLLNISGGSDCQGLVKIQNSEESLGSQKFSFFGTVFILEETIIIRSWLFPICLIVGFWD